MESRFDAEDRDLREDPGQQTDVLLWADAASGMRRPRFGGRRRASVPPGETGRFSLVRSAAEREVTPNGGGDASANVKDRSESALEKMEPPGKIKWEKDLVSAYEKAMAEGKPMVVQFSTEWCNYCKKLQKEVLSHEKMEELADKAVYVKVDPEKDSYAAELVKSLDIVGYPTITVLDAKADALNERGRVVGFLEVDKFVAQLHDLLPKKDTPLPDPLDDGPLFASGDRAAGQDEESWWDWIGTWWQPQSAASDQSKPEPDSLWGMLSAWYDRFDDILPRGLPADGGSRQVSV